MPTFTVPGAELDVELSDEGGRPVVQLHGLTSSRRRDRVLQLDLGRGLSGTRLLRYDARGHGGSTGRTVPRDYTWPRLAEDLLALLEDRFPGEAVHGAGPSMGCAPMRMSPRIPSTPCSVKNPPVGTPSSLSCANVTPLMPLQ